MENNSKINSIFIDSNVIDGRAIAKQLFNDIAEQVKTLSFQPVLCDVVVGDDPVSLSYVGIKEARAKECGFGFSLVRLQEAATETEVITAIKVQQQDENLCGLIVQLPLPSHIDSEAVLKAINSNVDVDLINPDSAAKFYSNESNLVPPTPGAIMHILDRLPVDLTKEHFLVLGQGELVGKPVTQALLNRNYHVMTAVSTTPNRAELLKTATVIITGVGKAGILTGDEVSENVIIIDAGTSESSGSIQGDVDFKTMTTKARYITPSPGGVGPVTVAKLLENVLAVAKAKS